MRGGEAHGRQLGMHGLHLRPHPCGRRHLESGKRVGSGPSYRQPAGDGIHSTSPSMVFLSLALQTEVCLLAHLSEGGVLCHEGHRAKAGVVLVEQRPLRTNQIAPATSRARHSNLS